MVHLSRLLIDLKSNADRPFESYSAISIARLADGGWASAESPNQAIDGECDFSLLIGFDP